MTPQSQIDALTPAVAADIDAATLVRPEAQAALGSGAVGSVIAGPMIKIVLARLMPVLEDQALKMLDAEVVQLNKQYPGVDFTFLHGLVQGIFDSLKGVAPSPAVGTMGPVS